MTSLPSRIFKAGTWDKCDRAAWLALLLTSLLRLTQLTRFELAPDEAYYWDWSRRLAWGYYDQGPMIAYVIRLTTTLFGTNEFGVRFGVWAASLGTILCCWLLARRLFSPLAGLLTVLLLAATPLMAVGSLIATYDPLLVFFWALALVFLERALFGPTAAGQRRAWLLAGIATGLGFLSKHTMVLALPCVVLFLLISPAHRKWLQRPEPYAAFLLSLLLYTGVLWWNATHHWWTFGHLLFLTHKSTNSPFLRLGEFVGSQALLLGPGLFLAALSVGYYIIQNRNLSPQKEAQRFLFCFGYPIFFFFCLVAFRTKVQANWAPCAWLTPTILWAEWASEAWTNKVRTMKAGARNQYAADEEQNGQNGKTEPARSGWLSSVAFRFAAVLGTSMLLTLLLVSPELRQAVGIRLKPKDDVTVQMEGWRSMAAHVQQLRTDMERGGHKVFLAGNGYQYCALIAFYLPDHPQTYDMFLHYRLTMYAAYVTRLKTHLGEDAIFLNDGRADDHDLRTVFEHVEWEEPPFAIWRRPLNIEPVRLIHIGRCYRYRRYTGLEWAVGG